LYCSGKSENLIGRNLKPLERTRFIGDYFISTLGVSMNHIHTALRTAVLALAIAATAYSGVASAAAHVVDDEDIVFDADEAPFGISYSQWTSRLWQHMLSIPAPINQFTEGTLNACWSGQNGPAWFLVGKLLLGGTSIRSCTIPADKALFFPVYNSIWIDTPGVCGQGAPMTVREMRTSATSSLVALTTMSVELDGKPIGGLREHRHKSQVFDVTLPEDNVFNLPCTTFGLGTVPGGVYAPAVDEGYYVMLKPMSEGGHTLRIRSADSNGFDQDVTYHLSVRPKAKH
jgi:hypothetical protein